MRTGNGKYVLQKVGRKFQNYLGLETGLSGPVFAFLRICVHAGSLSVEDEGC